MHLILLAALSLDGKLARTPHQFVNWSSKEDKRLFMRASKRAGVLIIGHNTWETLPAPLPGRLHIVLTRNPTAQQPIPGVVEFTSAPPPEIVADLTGRGYQEAIIGGGGTVNAMFLEHDLIDELWLTIEPLIFGGGIDLFAGHPFERRARLIHHELLNPHTLHLRYSLREASNE